MTRKIFAFFLAFAMLFNSVPPQAFATELGETPSENGTSVMTFCESEGCLLREAEAHETCAFPEGQSQDDSEEDTAGEIDEYAEGATGEGTEGATGEGAEGATDEGTEGATGEGAEGATGEGAEGATDEGAEGATGEGAEGETDEDAEGDTEEGAEGDTEEALPSEAVTALVAKLEALPSADMVTEDITDEVWERYYTQLEDAMADFYALNEEDMAYFEEHYADLFWEAMALNDALTGNEGGNYANISYDSSSRNNVTFTLKDQYKYSPALERVTVRRGSDTHQVVFNEETQEFSFTKSSGGRTNYEVLLDNEVIGEISRNSTSASFTYEEPGETYYVTFRLYYYIQNSRFPSSYAGYGDAADYGPSGDNTPFALLEVDLNALKAKAQEQNSPVVYNADPSNGNQWQFTPQGSPSDWDALAKTQAFWGAVMACAKNPEALYEYPGEVFFGYAAKKQGDGTLHIDGILDVELPVYIVELYRNGSFFSEFLTDNVSGNQFPTMANVQDRFSSELGFAENPLKWEHPTTDTWTAVYEANGRRYRATITRLSTDKGLGGATKEDIYYSVQSQDNTYYLAKYDLTTEDIGGVPYPITVTKVWEDDNDALELRPEAVTVRLMRGDTLVESAELSEANGWTHTFPDLEAVDGSGNLIQYRVEEEAVPYYVATYSGSRVDGFTVTNAVDPALDVITGDPGEVMITGWKNWDDQSDAAGTRPESITVVLYADGVEYAKQTVTGPDWTFSFDVSAVENAANVTFTLGEEPVEGYAVSSITHPSVEFHIPSGADGWEATTSCANLQYQNTADGKTVVAAKMTSGDLVIWSADALAEFERDMIVESLTGDNKVSGIGDPKNYVFLSGEGVSGAYDITVSSETITFKGSSAWSMFWVGTYTRGSSSTTAGSLTNSLSNGTVQAQKVWDDDDNREALRTDAVSLQLYKTVNGVRTAVGAPVSVTGNEQWYYQWTGLDKYENGAAVSYTVEETSVPEGYEVSYTVDETGRHVITNKHVTEKVTISAKKDWNDDNNRDKIRPASVELTVYADGLATDKKVTLTEAGGWTADITGLPRYRNAGGKTVEIVYTLEEETVPAGYTADIGNKDNHYTVTNTHTPVALQIPVNKIWEDEDDQDGIRPDAVKVILTGSDSQTYEATLNAGNNWSHTFTVPQYDQGVAITYSVEEETVPTGYSKTVSGYTITNTHVPEAADMTVVKQWNDFNNNDGKRPYAVAISLLRNGSPVSQADIAGYNAANTNPVILTAGDSWTGLWKDVPQYADGVRITYTTVETGVYMTAEDLAAGKITNVGDMAFKYTFVHDSYDRVNHVSTVVNTYTPARTTLNVQKVWDDGNNQDNSQPSSVTFRLWKTTDPARTGLVPSEENGWSPVLDANGVQLSQVFRRLDNGAWTDVDFANLLKYENGQRIYYSVTEEPVEGYTTTYHLDTNTEVVTVTNSYEVEKISGTVTKIWDDDGNRDALRPGSVTLNLFGINKQIPLQTVTLTAANMDGNGNWTYTFENLDKNYNGTPIVYTVTENAVEHYTPTYTANGSMLTITNTHTPATTDISFQKKWDDDSNRDGIRPGEVKVTLYADGKAERVMQVKPSDNWRGTFEDLPANKLVDGLAVPIVYTVGEADADIPAGYTAAVTGSADTGFVITNTHEPEMTSYTVYKVWEDNDDQDGIRPDTVSITLYANGMQVEERDFNGTGAEGWSYTWTNLHRYENGRPIVYTVDETRVPAGYTKSVLGNTVTNSYTPATVSVTVTKDWKDNENQDGIRPNLVKVYLVTNGQRAEKPVELYAGSGWTYTFSGLPKFADGVEIQYSVAEDQVAGYETPVVTGSRDSGFTVTNTHTPEKTSVMVNKVWDDSNNQDGLRPDTVTVSLKRDGTVVETAQLKQTDGWTYTFDNLDKYAEGRLIGYTVEEAPVEHYSDPVVTGSAAQGYTVTNSRQVDKTSVTVTKVWNDGNDQDGLRPRMLAVTLQANGNTVGTAHLNATNNWTYTWKNLDKNSGGQEIVYTVTEPAVSGYNEETGVAMPQTVTVVDGNATITNTHTPATISISATKVWEDDGNNDGKRPASVKLHLLADGDHALEAPTVVTADANWHHTWTGLPKFDNGREIAYTVMEEPVGNDYISQVTGNVTDGFTVTNTRAPDKTYLAVEKIWVDGRNQDGIRPDYVDVALWAEVSHTVAGAQEPAVTQKQVQTAQIKAENGWRYTFTNLPKYEDGALIRYFVKEMAVPGYTTAIHRDNKTDTEIITNTHIPETHDLTITKVWADNNNQDGKRPDSLELHLLANGEHTGNPVTLTAANADAQGNWVYTVKGLDKYANGAQIIYTVEEEDVPAGYTVSGIGTADNGFTVTNTHAPEKTSYTANKVWADGNNQDGNRPGTVSLQLYKTVSNVTVPVGEPAAVTAEANWSHTWEGLDKYENGELIRYSVDEPVIPEGYTSSVSGDTVTNSYTPATREITVTKIWNDQDNNDGKRPGKVTVHLMANGEHTGDPRELSADNNWQCTWENLPVNAGGTQIEYRVAEEVNASGYTPEVTGSADDGFVITNNYTPELTAVSILKRWNDGNDQDGVRPEKITVNLLADGLQIRSAELTEAGGWYYSFENLPKYAAGREIVYTVQELAVEGYDYPTSSAVELDRATDVRIITNTRTPAKTDVTVTKIWNDDDNRDAIRPDEIKLNLFGRNKQNALMSVTLTAAEHADADGNWVYTFTGLDKYYAGTQIVYTVTEEPVTGYTPTYAVDGTSLTVTNTHVPASTDVSFRKIWDDDTDRDGLRPRELTVTLYADGEPAKTMPVTPAEGWRGTFKDLPVYKNVAGQKVEIIYTVGEAQVPNGYTAEVTAGTDEDFLITNTHEVEKTSMGVVKSWEDADNNDGIRPYAIAVTLLDNGLPAVIPGIENPMILTAQDGWRGSWTDLPKNRGAEIIDYTAIESGMYQTAEDLAAGKMTTIADSEYRVLHSYNFEQAGPQVTITNRYNIKTRGLRVEKVWNDDRNREGVRPAELTVALFSKVDSDADWTAVHDGNNNPLTVTLNVDNNWTNSFTELPVYRNGETLRYAAREISYKDAAGTPWEIVHGEPILGKDGQKLYEIPQYSYSFERNLTTITNARNINRNVSVTVNKIWDDHDNQDGLRTDEITVRLYANGIATSETKTLNAGNNWTNGWTGLYDYYHGQQITYTVMEENSPAGYTVTPHTERTGDAIRVTFTNSYTPEQISIPVTKEWKDAENQDGIRPSSVTVCLYANGVNTGKSLELTAEGQWHGRFDNLPKNDGGKPIVYWVEEPAVEGYNEIGGIAQSQIVPVENGRIHIVNTHVTQKTSFTAKKVWDDGDNQDGNRPTSVTVHLLKNGVHTGDKQELKEANGWSYTWTGLEKNSGGRAIIYTVFEEVMLDDDGNEIYDVSYVHDSPVLNTVTNSYVPATTSFAVNKVWNDDNNRDNVRPASVTVTLQSKAGDGSWTDVQGADGKPLTRQLTQAQGWQTRFLDLPMNAAGQKIDYRVVETPVEGYEAPAYKLDETGYVMTVTNTRSLSTESIHVVKNWHDMDDNDGIRPDAITVQLYGNGTALEGRTAVLNAENGWKYTFTSTEAQPLYKNYAGKPIVYTVAEVRYSLDGQQFEGIAKGYESNVKTGETAYHLVIDNTHAIAKKSVAVSKFWMDGDDRDGIRPETVTVRLLSDGKDTGRTMLLNAANDWSGTWTDLPVYKNQGTAITYSVEEMDLAEGYTPQVVSHQDNHVLYLTNIHAPEVTDVWVTKTWDDEQNNDGKRPDGIIVQLYANGTALENRTVILNADNGWKGGFLSTDADPLFVYEAGKPITYSVRETGYILGGQVYPGLPDGYRPDYTGSSYDLTITNSRASELITVSTLKTWDDGNDNDRLRPKQVTVTLMRGEETVETVVLKEENQWKHQWSGLKRYQGGVEINYTVREDAVADYTVSYQKVTDAAGNVTVNVVNTHTPALWKTNITKVWKNDNAYWRPDYVVVQLYKDGVAYGERIRIYEANGWIYPVELPLYDAGQLIDWTVREVSVPLGYEVKYDQQTLTVTNRLITVLSNPASGDDFNLGLWSTVLGASGAGILGLLLLGKKKKSGKYSK